MDGGCRETGGVVRAGRDSFRHGARGSSVVTVSKSFLMPPPLREGVPEGHLVWTVLMRSASSICRRCMPLICAQLRTGGRLRMSSARVSGQHLAGGRAAEGHAAHRRRPERLFLWRRETSGGPLARRCWPAGREPALLRRPSRLGSSSMLSESRARSRKMGASSSPLVLVTTQTPLAQFRSAKIAVCVPARPRSGAGDEARALASTRERTSTSRREADCHEHLVAAVRSANGPLSVAPTRRRPLEGAEREQPGRRGQPDRHRAIGEYGRQREVGLPPKASSAPTIPPLTAPGIGIVLPTWPMQ